MANSALFSARSNVPETDTVNLAGGTAYAKTPDHALASIACVGCFNSTFYASATDQLGEVKRLAYEVDPLFLAKTAVMARRKGSMKDMPAFLTAVLYLRNPTLWKRVFPAVINSGRMLRTYAQIARSGAAGKVINLSSYLHGRAINAWVDSRDGETLFRDSVGNSPSLVGVLRQAHIKPKDSASEALLKYLFNSEFKWTHEFNIEELPELVLRYENFKRDRSLPVPDVDFRLLDSLGLTTAHWTEIFRNAGWTFTRMNLNTAERHGVLGQPGMVDLIAARLRDPEAVRKAKAFPYQLFMTFVATREKMPHPISEAIQDAVEVSLENVPDLGKVVVGVDVSGSMMHPVTGDRGTATSKVRNVDAAALIASAILRRNRDALVIPFANDVKPLLLNSRDSVLTNAATLTGILGGGTNCSAPLARLNREDINADTFVLLSDNESWIDTGHHWNQGNGTRTHEEWMRFKKRCPKARMICVDLSPIANTQVKERPDILQVAGFSDQVFHLMAAFGRGGNSSNFWVDEINKIEV